MTTRSCGWFSLLSLAGAFLLAAPGAQAAACLPGTLDTYLALGPGGCTVDNALFTDFVNPAGSFGATPVAPTSIFVNPLNTPFKPGLRFDITLSASAGEIFEALVGYNVHSLIIGNMLSMPGAMATADGAVTATEDKCIGGMFDGTGPFGCTGTQDALINYAIDGDAVTAASLAFPVTSVVGVVTQFVVDGGLAGSATGSGFANQFVTVPEPSAFTLIPIAAVFAYIRRRAVIRNS
jgi:hypothetical protein